MNREIIPYVSEADWLQARHFDITSTDCAALFGLSPYLTRFELWHRKRSPELVKAMEGNERMVWGQRLQDSIAYGVAEDQDFEVIPLREYMRIPEARIGSSFDYKIVYRDDDFVDQLLECKNVDSLEFARGWAETEFGLEAPTHIELQVQHQLLVSGLERAFIAALVGGNRVVLLERTADGAIAGRIFEEVAKFWAESEPAPTWPNDAAFVASLYGYSEPGKVIEADDETAALFREYAGYRAIAKQADADADVAKAKILQRIGDAERVTHSEFTLSAKVVKAAHIEYDRAEYRGFKLTPRGAKK